MKRRLFEYDVEDDQDAEAEAMNLTLHLLLCRRLENCPRCDEAKQQLFGTEGPFEAVDKVFNVGHC